MMKGNVSLTFTIYINILDLLFIYLNSAVAVASATVPKNEIEKLNKKRMNEC